MKIRKVIKNLKKVTDNYLDKESGNSDMTKSGMYFYDGCWFCNRCNFCVEHGDCECDWKKVTIKINLEDDKK